VAVAAEANVSGPSFGMIPRRVAQMRLPRRAHAVLDVIACHARGGYARLSRDTIASEARIDPTKVSFCTRWLEKNGLLAISGRGGRGLANTYRIIYDENGAVDGTVSDQNGADFGSKTVPILARNGAIFGIPTEIEQKERNTPPSGGVARAREGGFSVMDEEEKEDATESDGADRRQINMLLPIAGGGARGDASLDDYQPSQKTIELACELGLDALSKGMLDHWRDNRRANGKIPADPDADYRNWLRNEKRINPGGRRTEQRGPRETQQKKSTAQLLMAAALEQAARAEGR
jgi:hypothetical protein